MTTTTFACVNDIVFSPSRSVDGLRSRERENRIGDCKISNRSNYTRVQFDHESAVAAEFGVPDRCRSVGTVALGWPAPGGREPTRSAATGRPGGPGFVHEGGW